MLLKRIVIGGLLYTIYFDGLAKQQHQLNISLPMTSHFLFLIETNSFMIIFLLLSLKLRQFQNQLHLHAYNQLICNIHLSA